MPSYNAPVVVNPSIPSGYSNDLDTWPFAWKDSKRAYGVTISAENMDAAKAKFAQLGELAEAPRLMDAVDLKFMPMLKPSTHFARGDKLQAMHAMIFLAWINIQTGKLTAAECLSDEGYIHVLAHHLAFPGTNGVLREGPMLKYIRDFEAKLDLQDWE